MTEQQSLVIDPDVRIRYCEDRRNWMEDLAFQLYWWDNFTVQEVLACQPNSEQQEEIRQRGQIVREWSAFHTFLEALRSVRPGRPSLHLEDDVILTTDFGKKIRQAIAEHPDVVIQFFSLRKKDLTIGSRWESGRTFMMAQCFYLPPGMAGRLLEYAAERPVRKQHPNCIELMIADYLQREKQRYWLHVPSLVQHRVTPSLIDRRRSKFRQSPSFIE